MYDDLSESSGLTPVEIRIEMSLGIGTMYVTIDERVTRQKRKKKGSVNENNVTVCFSHGRIQRSVERSARRGRVINGDKNE